MYGLQSKAGMRRCCRSMHALVITSSQMIKLSAAFISPKGTTSIMITIQVLHMRCITYLPITSKISNCLLWVAEASYEPPFTW